MAGIGLSIDYTYLTQTQNRLQDAADTAALYAAREYRKTGKFPKKSSAANYLNVNFDKTGNEGKPVITRYELKGRQGLCRCDGEKADRGHGHFRKKFAELPASSTVNVGSEEKLEIVLSLDTTFSMTKSSGTSSDKLDRQASIRRHLLRTLTV